MARAKQKYNVHKTPLLDILLHDIGGDVPKVSRQLFVLHQAGVTSINNHIEALRLPEKRLYIDLAPKVDKGVE